MQNLTLCFHKRVIRDISKMHKTVAYSSSKLNRPIKTVLVERIQYACSTVNIPLFY